MNRKSIQRELSLFVLALVTVVACELGKKDLGSEIVTTGTGTATGDETAGDGGSGSGGFPDGSGGTGGDGSGTDDGVGEVDCAQIGPGEETVAPGPYGPLGLPTRHCNPRTSGAGEFKCCSDDPATPDGGLPDYLGKNIDGADMPIFSGINNERGTSGMCVRTDDIPPGAGMLEPGVENCPVPCNPVWDPISIAKVCGTGRQCCQTRAMGEDDCVRDPESGEFRPVTGKDIPVLTDWSEGHHDTHQDPGGVGCLELAGNDHDDPLYTDCIEQLTVANQRGYCMALAPGEVCPAEEPDYIDACEQLNGG